MIPAPPSSTLFPYTTLFRSRTIVSDDFHAPYSEQWSLGVQRQLTRKDRKSTRLNSSHLGISYAVFCLKKKKLSPSPQHGRGSRIRLCRWPPLPRSHARPRRR